LLTGFPQISVANDSLLIHSRHIFGTDFSLFILMMIEAGKFPLEIARH
jgi:formate hydrogenlyase subunit 4